MLDFLQVICCKQGFHADCIETWLSENSDCPVCNATIGTNKTIHYPDQGEEELAALQLDEELNQDGPQHHNFDEEVENDNAVEHPVVGDPEVHQHINNLLESGPGGAAEAFAILDALNQDD